MCAYKVFGERRRLCGCRCLAVLGFLAIVLLDKKEILHETELKWLRYQENYFLSSLGGRGEVGKEGEED